MNQTILNQPRSKNEPPYMRGYGDWANKKKDQEYHNPYQFGTKENEEYKKGWMDGMSDDCVPIATTGSI